MRRKYFIILFIAMAIVAFWGFYYALPRMFVDIKSTGFHKPPFEKAEYIHINSKDNLKLEAFVLEPKAQPKATIILVHGLRTCKEFYSRRAQELANSDYRVLAPDLRAHGNSEGTYCTFGVKEKIDMKLWVDYITAHYPKEKIGIWGQSLGGAVSLQTMGIDNRISFGIIESTFANFPDVGRDYLSRYFHFRSEALNGFIESRVRSMADFEPNIASPYKACKTITQPIFLVHGDQDKKINVKYVHENYKALNHPQKKLKIVSGGTHANIWRLGGEEYYQEVLSFIDQVLKE